MKTKIYLTCYDCGQRNYIGYALAEDGTALASHMSSSPEFSKHDLGLTSGWKHDIYQKYCPDGYVLEWVDNPNEHEGWLSALALNQAIEDEEEQNEQ